MYRLYLGGYFKIFFANIRKDGKLSFDFLVKGLLCYLVRSKKDLHRILNLEIGLARSR